MRLASVNLLRFCFVIFGLVVPLGCGSGAEGGDGGIPSGFPIREIPDGGLTFRPVGQDHPAAMQACQTWLAGNGHGDLIAPILRSNDLNDASNEGEAEDNNGNKGFCADDRFIPFNNNQFIIRAEQDNKNPCSN
jgi:hypothetical protein